MSGHHIDQARRGGRVRAASPGFPRRHHCLPRVEGLEGRELLAFYAVEFPTTLSVPTSRMYTAVAPSGNLWFTSSSGNGIGSITPSGATVQSIVSPAGSQPMGITAGPDGNLWFAEHGTSKLGRVTPVGALLPEITLHAGSGPTGITTGPDGNIWFTESDSNKLGRVTPAGALLPEIALHAGSSPDDITTGPDGNLWFTEYGTNRIGHITTAGALLPEIALPAGSSPLGITSGSDGNIWFVESGTSKVGHVTTAGVLLPEISLTAGSLPEDIAAAPDGNLYFTERLGGRIGMVTTAGAVTEVRLPPGAFPARIAIGLDGNAYFTDAVAGKMGRAVTRTFLTAAIAPADIHGTDGVNPLTNVTTPTFSGKTKGGAWVTIFTQGLHHITTRTAVGTAIANPIDGTWSFTLPVPLADDTYMFAAAAIDPLGGGPTPLIAVTPLGRPLVISTAPPVVMGASYDRRAGTIAFTLHGTKALDPATLDNTANYALSGYRSKKGPITIVGATMTTSGTDTRVVLQLGNLPKKRPKKITLRMISGGVRDGAGNALDGEFTGRVPTGDGHAGGDFVAPLPLKLRKK